MMLPVSLLRIRIVEGGRRKISLWIPLILIWPIVLALTVAASPVALLLCIVWPKGRSYVLAGPRVMGVCWALRGLEVQVKDGKDKVLVSFR